MKLILGVFVNLSNFTDALKEIYNCRRIFSFVGAKPPHFYCLWTSSNPEGELTVGSWPAETKAPRGKCPAEGSPLKHKPPWVFLTVILT